MKWTSMKLRSKTLSALATLIVITTTNLAHAATNDLTSALQKGLFEEEANHNYPAAIEAYESVVSRFDDNRKLAATAIFRLGEIYRKQGRTNEAAAQYQRIVREFADQAPLTDMSRQTLAALGNASGSEAATKPENRFTSTSQAEEFERIRNLIKNSPDLINAPGPNDVTLLESAAAQDKLAIATMLIENGAAVDGVKSGGLTPLHFAAGNGHKAMVDLLLSKGAKAGTQTSQGLTPLHLAVSKGYETVAKTLIDAGASVNAALRQPTGSRNLDNLLTFNIGTEGTPLHAAVDAGYASVVSLLISNRTDVNAEAGDRSSATGGRTALSVAVERNFAPIVQILLEGMADPNTGAVDLPLHRAIQFGRSLAMIRSLLEHGADPKKVSHLSSFPDAGQQNYSPLELAVNKKNVEVIKLLLAAKADPNELWSGRPIVFRALSDPATLQALLDGGANPNVRYDNSREYDPTPLDEAANSGQEKQVDELIAHGADVNSQAKNGVTPLHNAARNGSTNIVAALLKAGAQVDPADNRKLTPLFYAVFSRRAEVVGLLLEKGADANHRDGSGKTALEVAKDVARSDGLSEHGLPRVTPIPGTSSTSVSGGTAPPADKVMLDLLRQFGAVDDLPKFDRIEIRRPSANFSTTVFSKEDNDWNRFTLIEAVAKRYGFLSDQPGGTWSRTEQLPASLFKNANLPFPDFDHVVIHRPAADGKSWGRPINVSLAKLFDSGECQDGQLQWGDVIEIPEADHPVADTWQGITGKPAENLIKCVSRNINVVLKGTNTQLKLAPELTVTDMFVEGGKRYFRLLSASFMIRSALDQLKLIRFSSDLAHVKVKRHDADTGKDLEWTLDCSDQNHAPAFWLRDGDTVEIPDRT